MTITENVILFVGLAFFGLLTIYIGARLVFTAYFFTKQRFTTKQEGKTNERLQQP